MTAIADRTLEVDGLAVSAVRIAVGGSIPVDVRDDVHYQLVERLLLGAEAQVTCTAVVAGKSWTCRDDANGDAVVLHTIRLLVDTVEAA
jgi:hypothetical protein